MGNAATRNGLNTMETDLTEPYYIVPDLGRDQRKVWIFIHTQTQIYIYTIPYIHHIYHI